MSRHCLAVIHAGPPVAAKGRRSLQHRFLVPGLARHLEAGSEASARTSDVEGPDCCEHPAAFAGAAGAAAVLVAAVEEACHALAGEVLQSWPWIPNELREVQEEGFRCGSLRDHLGCGLRQEAAKRLADEWGWNQCCYDGV